MVYGYPDTLDFRQQPHVRGQVCGYITRVNVMFIVL